MCIGCDVPILTLLLLWLISIHQGFLQLFQFCTMIINIKKHKSHQNLCFLKFFWKSPKSVHAWLANCYVIPLHLPSVLSPRLNAPNTQSHNTDTQVFGSLIKSTKKCMEARFSFSPFVDQCLGEPSLLVNVNNLPLSWWNLNCASPAGLTAINQCPPWPEKEALAVVGRGRKKRSSTLKLSKSVHRQWEAQTRAKESHWYRLMTTLHQLN